MNKLPITLALKTVSLGALLIALSIAPTATFAQSSDVQPLRAVDLVQDLVGAWRGGGVVETRKGKRVKLRCSTRNVLDSPARTLNMRGRCAASVGVRPLVAHLSYSEDGAQFVDAAFKMANHGGATTVTINGDELILHGETTLKSGATEVQRNIIRKQADGYSIMLYGLQDGEYQLRGTLTYKPKKTRAKKQP